MTDVQGAAKALGCLLSVFKDDGKGTLDFSWFSDPTDKMVKGIPGRRVHIKNLLTALGTTPGSFSDEYALQSVIDSSINAGVAWSDNEDETDDNTEEFEIGLGAKMALGPGKLGVLARLIGIDDEGTFESRLGQVSFSGEVVHPYFLEEVSLNGDIGDDGSGTVTLSTKYANTVCDLQLVPSSGHTAEDLARMALYVLSGWISHDASTNAPTFPPRLNAHLVPLLSFSSGEAPATPIPFPLSSDAMGSGLLFADWAKELTMSQASTLLWHVRALLTGNEDTNFFDGSVYLSLSDLPSPPNVQIDNGLLENLSERVGLADDTAGWWIGLEGTSETPANPSVVLRAQDGDGYVGKIRFSDGNLVGEHNGVDAGTETFKKFSEFCKNGLSPVGIAVTTGESEITLKKNIAIGLGTERELQVAVTVRADLSASLSLNVGPANVSLNSNGLLTLNSLSLDDLVGLFGESEETTALKKLAAILTRMEHTQGDIVADVIQLMNQSQSQNENQNENQNQGSGLQVAHSVTGPEGSILSASLKIDVDTDGPNVPTLEGSVGIRNLTPGADWPIHVGGLDFEAKLTLEEPPTLADFRLGLTDIRLNKELLGLSGVMADALPDLSAVEGFDLSINSDFELSGGGTFAIQRSIGPFYLGVLRVAAHDRTIEIDVDGEFSLLGMTVAPYDLGISISTETGSIEPHLGGLGLSFDASGVKLEGMFARLGADEPDFVGGALVSVAEMFELSAIGGYSDTDGGPSMFIFASLVAPLGGPPWCVITGIAGGFGYQRKLPVVERPSEHPFMTIMAGELFDEDEGMAASLQRIGQDFAVSKSSSWIAAGLQFTSFGFLNGKLVATLGFGKSFSVGILGSVEVGIERLAYFGIDFAATIDAEHFYTSAHISSKSYIIDPGIASLQGSVALAVWYDGEHSGDFMFSVGGFHPYFLAAPHYGADKLDRVRVKTVLWMWLNLEIEGYFAITPQAMMGGGAIKLWAEFAGISAGLRAWVDVLMCWEPFFIRGNMGVAVWFEFLGHHEVSVVLDFWSPQLGGTATVDLSIITFVMEFGEPEPDKGLFLSAHQFVSNQLRLPPVFALDANDIGVLGFGEGGQAGLFDFSVLWGRSAGIPKNTEGDQEGLRLDQPIRVGPDFGIQLRTRIPAGEAVQVEIAGLKPDAWEIGGMVDLPLCGKVELESLLSLSVASAPEDAPLVQPACNSFTREFPDAQFGLGPSESNFGEELADSPENIVFSGTEGLRLEYGPKLEPGDSKPIASREELSTKEQQYPLPLPGAPDIQMNWPHKLGPHKFGPTTEDRKKTNQFIPGLALVTKLVRLPRGVRPTRIRGPLLGVSSKTKRIAVPESPSRRPELAHVSLQVAESEASLSSRRTRVARHTRGFVKLPQIVSSTDPQREKRVPAPLAPLAVAAGDVGLIERGAQGLEGTARLSGTQTARVLCVNRFGLPTADSYLQSGVLKIPSATRAIVLFGEGNDSPVVGHTPPRALEPVGVDPDTMLVSITPGVFAARGCTVQCNPNFRGSPKRLDVVSGQELLGRSSRVRMLLPALKGSGSVVIVLRRRAAAGPDAADALAWSSLDASLRLAKTIESARTVAFIYEANAPTAWSLDTELHKSWQYLAIAACPRSVAESEAALKRQPLTELVDDRWTPAVTEPSTLSLELAQ